MIANQELYVDMYVSEIHVCCQQKHFLNIFYFVSTLKINCFSTKYNCPPLAILNGCAIIENVP